MTRLDNTKVATQYQHAPAHAHKRLYSPVQRWIVNVRIKQAYTEQLGNNAGQRVLYDDDTHYERLNNTNNAD